MEVAFVECRGTMTEEDSGMWTNQHGLSQCFFAEDYPGCDIKRFCLITLQRFHSDSDFAKVVLGSYLHCSSHCCSIACHQNVYCDYAARNVEGLVVLTTQ